MPEPSTDVIKGTLELFILRSVRLEPMHGFGIARRIEQVSSGVFRVNPGSLLLAFRRLERDGLIAGEWRVTESNRRARFYRLTDAGRKRLKVDAEHWGRRVAAITRLLET